MMERVATPQPVVLVMTERAVTPHQAVVVTMTTQRNLHPASKNFSRRNLVVSMLKSVFSFQMPWPSLHSMQSLHLVALVSAHLIHF
jgi:precorrin-6B methylase 2